MSAILRAGAIRRAACLVVAVWVAGSLAAAQERKVKPPVSGPPLPVWPADLEKVLNARKLPAEKILASGAMAPGDENILKDYFGTVVKGFTIKEVIPGLWHVRLERIRKPAIEGGRVPNNAAQAWLRQFLFTEMQKLVANDKLPPESRVNALLVIGDLNEKEPVVTPPATLVAAPVPLVAATPYLLQIYDTATTPSFLRVPALRGLHRHAELGINAAHQQAVLASMLKALQDANVPKDCSPGAHEFMRRRAAQIVGHLKDSSAAKPLLEVVADAEAPLTLRCDAARSLGMLTYKPGDPVAGTAAAAQALGDLAATAAETEQTERRLLRGYLECVRVGLNGEAKTVGGVRAATPQAQAKLAGDLFALIDPLVKTLDPVNSRYKEDQLADDAATLAQGLRNLVPAAAPAKAKEAKAPAAKAKEEKAEPQGNGKTADPPKAAPKADPAKAAPAKASEKTGDAKG